MNRIKKGGAVVAICVAFVGGFEGLRQTAYRDSTGIPTICYGETRHVHMGEHETLAECKGLLAADLNEFGNDVEKCITRPMNDQTFAAFVSLAYNLGGGGFCRSDVAKAYNRGQETQACESMTKYNTAGGIPIPGLTRRREAERQLCLKGLQIPK